MNHALANARFKALLGTALLDAITSPWAKNLRVAVQGDALSMDPHSLAQAVPLSFTGNVCEPLDTRKGARGHWNLGAYSNTKLDALTQEALALHRDDIGRVLSHARRPGGDGDRAGGALLRLRWPGWPIILSLSWSAARW